VTKRLTMKLLSKTHLFSCFAQLLYYFAFFLLGDRLFGFIPWLKRYTSWTDSLLWAAFMALLFVFVLPAIERV
jgi:hypothetical protein